MDGAIASRKTMALNATSPKPVFREKLVYAQFQSAGDLSYSVRRLNPCFSLPPCRRTTAKKSGGSETKRGLRRISGVGGHGVSQEPIAKSPAWCGALSA